MEDEASFLLDCALLLRAHWKHLLLPGYCIAHGKQELRYQAEIVGSDAMRCVPTVNGNGMLTIIPGLVCAWALIAQGPLMIRMVTSNLTIRDGRCFMSSTSFDKQ